MRSLPLRLFGLPRSYAEVSKVMKDKLSELAADPNNEEWAIFFGWDPELIPDLPTLSADYLDANFSSTIPIAVIGQSGHVAWVNRLALETPEPVVSVGASPCPVKARREGPRFCDAQLPAPCKQPPSPSDGQSTLCPTWQRCGPFDSPSLPDTY